MNILDSSYIDEQTKIAGSGAWIWLLEIATPGRTTLRYANNNSDIGWPLGISSNTYSKLSITMDDISVSTSGEFPIHKLQIGDVDLDGGLRERVKVTAGLVGSTVRLIVVHSSHLDLLTPAIDEIAEVLNCEVTAEAVVLTIGVPSLLSKRFPRDRYVPSFCRHKFGGALCRYVQPDYSLTSTAIRFTTSGDYNIIQQVISGSLVSDVFSGAPGEPAPIPPPAPRARWKLDADTVFEVSGSVSNNGWFVADASHLITQSYVRVFNEADGGRAFVAEAPGASVIIQLGYSDCDHTLEACKLRNNSQNYGGSPGIAGGMYG